MAKDLTGNDYLEFLNYFTTNHSKLRSKFPSEIKWSLLEVPYGVTKPKEMNDEDFDSFREIELRWLIENGIADETKNKPLFILVKAGRTSIDINKVVSIEKITNTTSKVEIKHENGLTHTFEIFGSIDFVKMKLNPED